MSKSNVNEALRRAQLTSEQIAQEYTTAVRNGMCPCGVDHMTGNKIMNVPTGRGFNRTQNMPPTKTTLYINGLPPNILKETVSSMLSRATFPSLAICNFVKTVQTFDRSYSFAFVTVHSAEEAARLYEAIDGHKHGKNSITVRDARDRTSSIRS